MHARIGKLMKYNKLRILQGCVLAWVLFAQVAVGADAYFEIKSARTKDISAVFYLDAEASLTLSDAQHKALQNGLTLAIDVLILIEQRYWRYFFSDVAELQQRYLISYHALTEQYLLQTVNSGKEHAFDTLDDAMKQLGKFRNLPLIDRSLLDTSREHRVLMKAQVDVDALPLTLQPLGYFTQEWGTESEWLIWPLAF